jgi:hypothetical protein
LLALRIVGIAVLLTTVGGVLLYFVTRDRRYLRWAYRIFQAAVIFALFLFGLLALEHLYQLL